MNETDLARLIAAFEETLAGASCAQDALARLQEVDVLHEGGPLHEAKQHLARGFISMTNARAEIRRHFPEETLRALEGETPMTELRNG